jgi:hypothetical protein
MDSASIYRDGTTKKRPSKSLRACWECKTLYCETRNVLVRLILTISQGKRRKVHGYSTSEGDVSGLGAMGNFGSGNSTEEHVCPIHIGERLSKLEQLFDRFVCRKQSHVPTPEASPAPPRSPTLVGDSTEKQSKYMFGLPELSSDTQSISSIGEGIVSCHAPLRIVQLTTDDPSLHHSIHGRPRHLSGRSSIAGGLNLLRLLHVKKSGSRWLLCYPRSMTRM